MMRNIIACLDIKDGRVVKGVNFVQLRDMGDPVELARYYSEQGADELVFLDITRSDDHHQLMLDTIRRVSEAIEIPLTVGGGISSVEEAAALLEAGANKVSISSAAIRQPDLINQISEAFGSNSLTIAIDTAYDVTQNDYFIYSQGGRQQENRTVADWAKEVEARGAGSLLVTSIQHDGVKKGFDIEGLNQVKQAVNIPVIASGGAGSIQDFIELFQQTDVEAGLAASIFHQNIVEIPILKNTLIKEGIDVSR